MRIMIDNLRVIDVEADLLRDEDGDLRVVLGLHQTATLLDAWKGLSELHRNYRYGDDEGAATVIIAYVNGFSGFDVGRLVMEDVDPFWNGSYTVDGYSLEGLASALPADALRWGEAIGEPDPLAGAR